MSLPAYAEYQDSGVEWLGDVPKHWDLKKIFHSFASIGSGTTPKSDEEKWYSDDGVPWVTTGELRENTIFNTTKHVTHTAVLSHSALKLHPAGSLVMAMYGATIGRLGILGVDAVTNQACCVLSGGKNLDIKYVYYWLHVFKETIISLYSTGGGQPNINQENVTSLRVSAPDVPEQTTIARFLDHETAKIDALIAEQQRLIELLKEKRQAVISHAVTKGLDPNAPMKDSGVAWLGDVPEHWVKIQLGRVCKQVSDGPHFSPKYVDDGVMFLSARNIGVDAWYLDDAKFISDEDYKEFCRRVIPERGDILYTKGGTTGVARVVDLDMPFQVWVHVAVLKLRLKLAVPDYVAFALNSHGCYEQAKLYTHGATNQDLGLTRMVKIWLALPSVKEQSAIVSFLNAATAKIDELISSAHQGIDLLKERRSALISAAVTGKIDVRDWQPPATAATIPQGQQQILFDD